MAVSSTAKRQIGTIVLGNGINADDRIKELKEKGYEVIAFNDHIQVWAEPKQIKK